ncbi:WcaI family glycosyltransferase [Rhodopirellula bahusiensis]|uniref:WcaI family glycosyltransferase n=1 Tax=Rhodopirellula bahusiensis TaxID=2014065 RepID=UPI0032632764
MHGLNFSPEEIGIGKYSGEMVSALAEAGHEVMVVTTPPYYPHWKIGEGYSGFAYRREISSGDCPSKEQTAPEGSRPSANTKRHGAELDASSSKRDPGPSATVIRCPLWVPGKVTGLKRILHLASFGMSSIPVVLWQALRFRPDVVMTVEPAAMCMPTTWIASRLCGAKCWLHVQDFEIDAAFELGILKQPLLKRFVLAAEAFLMRRFDRVSSISPNMLFKLVQKGVEERRVVSFPNWVDCEAMKPFSWPTASETLEPAHNVHEIALQSELTHASDTPLHLPTGMVEQSEGRAYSNEGHDEHELSSGTEAAENQTETIGNDGADTHSTDGWERRHLDRPEGPDTEWFPRKELDELRASFAIPPGKCVALYAGNMGAKQGLELIVEAARRTTDNTELHYVLCGTGASFQTLSQACESLPNVQMLPVQPFEQFNALMNCADIHLLPQRAGAADLVMPSKLTGMLATGRPVVACADPGTQISDVVQGHGLVVKPDDASGFTEAIERLALDPQQRGILGRAARRYAVENLSHGAILGQLMTDLKELVGDLVCAANPDEA